MTAENTGSTGVNTGVGDAGTTGHVGMNDATERMPCHTPQCGVTDCTGCPKMGPHVGPRGPKGPSYGPRRATPVPFRREKTPRRNDPCPCGSGKKAKHCCLRKIKFFASLPQQLRENIIVGRLLHPPIQPAPAVPLPVVDAFERTGAALGMTEVDLNKIEKSETNENS